jgi:anaerobic selenocysteine-containing dehydrogenase
MCGLEIQVKDGQIHSIKGDKDDPFSRGHICPKAVALQDVYHDPNRLKFPLRRTATGWEQIGWDEAFNEVVSRLQAIQAQHGRNAVGVYLGNPNVHNVGSLLYNPPFIRALRTKNRFSATSVDQLPHHLAAYLMFGHYLLLPVPDVDRTDYFLMLGANPVASNGSLMTAAGIEGRLKAMQTRGGKLVVIDPRSTETAQMADEHHFIRPGADALFLWAVLHTLFAEGLVDLGRLAGVCDGLETVAEIAAAFPPSAVESAISIPASTIERIAREFAAAPSAVAYGRIGLSTQPFGGLCQWLLNLINIVTGNMDNPGGAMFTHPAIDAVAITSLTGGKGSYGRWRSRVRNLPEIAGELPAAALAEEILTPGEGQIKAMVTVAGNPVLSTPNGRQLDEALAGLEFMVAVDIYLNETTRHAHIILPPATGLETSHYDLVFHVLAVQNTAKFSPALFEPEPGMKEDWQILRELRLRLEGNRDTSRKKYKFDFFRRLSPDKVIDLAIRFGPYGRGREGLTLSRLRREVHGVDLGPLRPSLPDRLGHTNKRISLAPDLLVQDLTRLKTWWQTVSSEQSAVSSHQYAELETQNSKLETFLLIGRRHLRSNNSWMHNSERLVKGKERCTVMVNRGDAAALGLMDGQMVEVRSRVGCITLPTELTDDIMPGVVSIPHGWGHNRPGIRLDVAQQHPGASLNDLTDEQALDELTGNAAFSAIPVTLSV